MTNRLARLRSGSFLLLVLVLAGAAHAQSLDERLDEDAFLRGLIDLDLPEVLEHYLELHPPANPGQVAQYRVEAQALRLRRLDRTAPGHAEALERLLRLRADLVRRYRDHPRRALWLADQASDLFFVLLPADASGLTSLFGVPSATQLERAQRIAGQMQGLLVQAELEIERAILEIETRPDFQTDQGLRMQRRRLARDERERRIPFLQGVAACLFGELTEEEPAARREHYEFALDLLSPLCQSLDGLPGRQARLYCGLAAARLGRFEQAEGLFARVATDADAPPTDVFAARMSSVLNHVQREGPSSGLVVLDEVETRYRAAGDLYYRILIADQRFLLRRRLAARGSGPADRRVVQQAFDAYLDLLDGSAEADREPLRRIVFERLARAASINVSLGELPPVVTVARADRLSREPARRAEAIALFESALERRELAPRDRALALYGLATGLHAEGRSRAAAARFAQLAREHPDDPQAERSIQLAATLLWERFRAEPRDERTRAELQETVDLLLTDYADLAEVDRWRYAAGKVRLAAGDHAAAAAAFAEVSADAAEWPDARFMIVNALREQLAAAADPLARREAGRHLAEEVDRAGRTVAQMLADAPGDRAADLRYYAAHLRVFGAEALIALDDPAAAIEALRAIERDPGLDETALGRALRVRVDAYAALERPAEARRELERFLTTAPEQGGRVLATMLAAVVREVDRLIEDDRLDDALDRAQRDAAPLAELVERWLEARKLPRDERVALVAEVASAYRQSGRYADGLRLYNELARTHPDAVEVLFGRAECLFGLGETRFAEAIGIYKRLAAAGPSVGSGLYWQSQLRMLLILDLARKSTQQIVPRIERLRLQDPEFGGRRFKRQFERLANKYA